MSTSVSMVGLVSYSTGAAAFLVLTLVIAIGHRHRAAATLMATASVITTAWCLVNAVHFATGRDLAVLTGVLEQARTGAWLLFLFKLLVRTTGERREGSHRPYYRAALVAFVLALAFELFRPLPAPLMAPAQYILRLTMVVIGFALIENLVRGSSADQRWSLKYLCLGLGGIFTYELFFYADALLFQSPSSSLAIARGAVHALVVPLLIVSTARSEAWAPRIALSQKSATYSTALIASGLYLLVMAASAFYIRLIGGSWGPFVQATFLFGCLVVLAVILTSGSARAHLKVLIAKHFFRYRFDYREEWVRFMATVSAASDASPLPLRVVRAIATPVECTAGAIWLRHAERFSLASTWNMTATSVSEAEAASLIAFVKEREWIVDIGEAVENGEGYEGLRLPEALTTIPDAWIIVPLSHQGSILGFVVLGRPRAPRRLNWEDYDILRLLARQSASYLAEQSAAKQLAEARQFERFNRRTTFVMHDLKNLVSQLSLVSTNMQKHGDNPEFRADMTAVMTDAIAKMKRLMDRLHAEHETGSEAESISLRSLLDNLVAVENQSTVDLLYDPRNADVCVAGDRDRLMAMLAHIVRNAVDAGGPNGWVKIALNREDDHAIVEVTDNGPGMAPEFIENQLFKPFNSTKKEGFGIGAFQSRQYARELGGDVEVISSRGAGTTMRVILPVAGAAKHQFAEAGDAA